MRVPAPPRLAQLAHFFQVNPAAVFGNKSIASIRRHHQDPFGTSAPLPSPTASTSSTSASTNSGSSSSSDADPTFDTETVPDDRTLVEEQSRRRSSSSHSDAEADEASSLTLLSDIPEEEASYLNFKRRRTVPSSCGRGRRPASSSEGPDPSARLSIIYPLPSAESLLAAAHGPTPSATVIDASIAPPLCTPSPLSPPPAHYKRRRARIMSDEDHDSDPNQAPIRFLANPESTLRFPF
ncbi:hypothetical protein F5888DRAFT_1638431 [Russula emetica]|nr:hypothetical protein F5888DRAFT_1638431 [Russula emetica]